MKKINFKQPKYVLPAILYFPLLGLGWLIIDIFHTEIKERPTGLQTTEYLNSDLPSANVKDIGNKRDNMLKSFGKIRDESAVNIAGRDSVKKEDFDSKYSDEEVAQLEEQVRQLEEEQKRAAEAKAAEEEKKRQKEQAREDARKGVRSGGSDAFSGLPTEEERLLRNSERQTEMFAELERELGNSRDKGAAGVLAEYRRRYGALSDDDAAVQDTVPAGKDAKQQKNKKKGGFHDTETEAVNTLDEDADDNAVVKKRKGSSAQFNTISENTDESKMLRAIIDEEIKVVDGSRVRLRLLDDAEVSGITLKKGSYLYCTMSGFSKQRVQGKVESIMAGDNLVKVSLSVYDLDGLEGLYVPESAFRETSKEVVGGAFQQSMGGISQTISTGDMLTNFAGQAIQNAYQKTSNAIAKAIKKNKVRLKYGTQIYLLNGKSQQKKKKEADQKAAAARQQSPEQNLTPSQQNALDRYRRRQY